jgi:hypothetical protein
MLVCFNNRMASKAHNSGMWISLTAGTHRNGHHAGYGEAQSTRNSRFLELADVILSRPAPVKEKAADEPEFLRKIIFPRKSWQPDRR